MPGMHSGLNTDSQTVVSAFETALVHQGLVALLLLALVAVAWNVCRSAQLRLAARAGDRQAVGPPTPEPAARRVVRIAFALLWIFDGILQGQVSMPLGLVPQGISPTAASSPAWVQHIVNVGATIWSYHPVSAAAASVWIQVGIGLWLLVAPRGRWSRLAGAVSVGWGVVVWVFGESLGGIFAPGASWLFGVPGAVVFYCAAGVLVALPERSWSTPALGRRLLRAMGAFFLAMAVLQAWPGRGFWQGRLARGGAGALTAMVRQMAQTPQPHVLSSWVAAFAAFDAAHGWAVNLFVVLALAATGVWFLSGRPAVVRVGVVGGIVLCLADWLLVQDLGFLGGTGTDPNSMIPMALVFVAGYVALTRVRPAPGGVVVPMAGAAVPGWWERALASPTYAFRATAALGAIGVVLLGAVHMAAAAADPAADPILSEAINGAPVASDAPAPAFHLVDQRGQPVSLSGLRGKTIGLTFLDPVCTSDCPLIAQEFKAADAMLGADAAHVVLVAVDANPRYVQPEFLRAFDAQEGLDRVPNWRYLTGSVAQLTRVWNAYGCQVSYEPGGAMIAHSDLAYVIDRRGHTRDILNADPGPATAATQSSFSVLLANALRSASS